MRVPVLLALAAAMAANSESLQNGAVTVEIFEDLPKGSELSPGDAKPVFRYTEPYFAFPNIPTKYSPEALALDRSVPFVLRATHSRVIAPGAHQIRLRARGASILTIDGREAARTKAQKPNTSSDDPVPPPVEKDASGRRPAPYPHQDVVIDFAGDGKTHEFQLTTIIGGKGLMPTPGELSVAIGSPKQVERLLGPDGSPLLTDENWEKILESSSGRHTAADRARRLEASKEITAKWRQRHDAVRAFWRDRTVAVPAAIAGYPGATEIDRFLAAKMKAGSVEPRPSTEDLDFLRRLTIDTVGMIPSPEEVRAFMKDSPATRRKNAIERLLAATGWADNWVSYWQDVLAENPGILKPDLNNTGPFRFWIHQSFQDGVPFDRFVTELIQMEGSSHQGAPAGFAQATLNDVPMAAKADIIGQAFLGQKLGCARCHDAPFHPYKQKDLFSMAAMLAGKPLKLPPTSTVPVVEGRRKPAVQITLKPGEMIAPDWPFADLVKHNENGAPLPTQGKIDSRRQFAELVVSPGNERFARVVVNRVWKRYMGLGIVEPVEDWARAKASHPEMLDWLAREFVMSGYDLRHVSRLIFQSHVYQRKPVTELTEQTVASDKRFFAGPLRRRMSAEQLVDSLHLAAGKPFECEELNLNPAGDRAPNQFLNMGKPDRAWQMTALSNERDRPALALPVAQSIVDVMTTYGWRQSRQSPTTSRDDSASPMQTLILANGVLGTRMIRLSDDSAFTALAMKDVPVTQLITETFVRVLSRPPAPEELKSMRELLEPYYKDRKVAGAAAVAGNKKTDTRVSWSNHLSAEATRIRMEEERNLRMGDQPTARLKPAFRERYEDALWAMVNSPEFVLMP